MHHLALVPLALFVLAIFAAQFPATASFCELLMKRADAVLWINWRPENMTPHEIPVLPTCEFNFFDGISNRPLVFVSRREDRFVLFDRPGYDPATSDELQPVTSEMAQEIVAWCRKKYAPPPPEDPRVGVNRS